MTVRRNSKRAVSAALALALACLGCGPAERGHEIVLTFPSSAVGAEADVLETQLTRFVRLHPGIHVVRQTTPDAADQRHQLYVQWLNAGASAPDIVQLDVIWTPEFAAAGWLMPLDHFRRSERPFFRYDDPDLGTPIALLVLAFQRRIVRTFAGLA